MGCMTRKVQRSSVHKFFVSCIHRFLLRPIVLWHIHGMQTTGRVHGAQRPVIFGTRVLSFLCSSVLRFLYSSILAFFGSFLQVLLRAAVLGSINGAQCPDGVHGALRPGYGCTSCGALRPGYGGMSCGAVRPGYGSMCCGALRPEYGGMSCGALCACECLRVSD